MDIIVTIPRKEKKYIEAEEEWAKKVKGPYWEFWRVGRRPAKLEFGDRVYFIEDGQITCYQIFEGFEEDFTCEATGRFWPGLNLRMQAPAIELKNPVSMRGFQGFRYTKEKWD